MLWNPQNTRWVCVTLILSLIALPTYGETRGCKPQDLDRVLRAFRDLAQKIYRPSGHEEQARAYILHWVELVNTAIRVLNRTQPSNLFLPLLPLATQIDHAGNLLVILPPTGKFTEKFYPSIALQSHLDMVMAAADGIEATEAFFKQPIELETVDGWIQSKGRYRTIGADNGLGVALMIRYLTDLTLEHPPLELLFTVHEEAAGQKGMVGAKNLGHRLRSPVLLNFDIGKPNFACVGCQGGQSVHTQHFVTGMAVPVDHEHMHLQLDGLAGGHSGSDIHRGRANSVLLWAQLMKELSTAVPSVLLTEVKAGNHAYPNVIPSYFQFSIAFPKADRSRVEAFLTSFLPQALQPFAEAENLSKVQLQRSASDPSSQKSWALNQPKIQQLTSLILDLQNGVVISHPDFPEGVQSSSNLAYAYLMADRTHAPGFVLKMGFLARSFQNENIDDIIQDNLGKITHAWGDGGQTFSERFKPWREPEDSWLIGIIRTQFPEYQVGISKAGYEPAALRESHPHMKFVIIGFNAPAVHSPEERFEIASVAKTIADVDRLIELIAQRPEFLATPP